MALIIPAITLHEPAFNRTTISADPPEAPMYKNIGQSDTYKHSVELPSVDVSIVSWNIRKQR
jgi:hypothetical protein